ncbi:MAG: J domain-containing protein, partial [Candidatus Aenigmatarchaeota archaeon]
MPFIEDLKKKAQEWAKRQAEKLKQSTIYHLPGAIAETIEKPRETFERIFAPKQIEREAQRIQKTGKVSMPRLFVEELAKETAATAIDIGKEFAKTPLKIGAEIGSRFLGGEYAKTQPAFKIPGLGEITTYTADYHQRKKEFKEKHGLSEKEATIASLLMTGGEAILDATLIASMAAKAAAPKLPALEEKIKSWYVLGQPKTIDEAKETYTQLAHQLHPDMPTGDETAFKTIQKAFETLNKKGIPNVIERAASKIFRPLVQAAYAPIREFGKPIEIPQLPLAQLPGYAEEQIMPVPMAGTIKKKIPVGKEIIKLPRVEEIAEKLGIKIIRTKSRGDTLKIQLTKLPGDKYAIKIPQNLNINSPEVQYSLWHEIGHFIDNAAYVGKNQLVSIVQRGKYSTPHSELLRKFKDYIIKHKPIKPQLTITVPKVGKFRNLEEIERADLPPEIKIKVREAWEKWIKKIENYLMQDIELFADGFARYIQNRDLMKKEAPELVKIYDEILEKEPILKTIFKKIPIETPPDIKPIVDDFLSIVKDLRKTRRLQEKLYTAERSRRLKEILKIRETSKGLESFYRELGALKGPLPHLPPEELTKIISPERAEKLRNYIDALFDYIVKHPALNEWEKIPAREALLKLMGERGGGLPTKSELKYLKRVFGNEFVKNVLEMRSTINKTLDAIVEVAGLPKAFIAAGDISATFRQALPLIYKKEFWANIPEQIKYFFSQRTFENAMK